MCTNCGPPPSRMRSTASLRGAIDGKEIMTVHPLSRDAEALGPPHGIVAADRPLARGGLGVAVVLEHEEDRQLVDRREVHRLERRALVEGAIAEECDGDTAGLALLGGQRGAARERRSAADNAVGAQHALADVGDVHRAALAFAQAALAPEDLLHHAVDIAALADAVAMPAVGAGDVVGSVELHADADGRCLLAGVEMDEARYLARGELLVHPLFEFADGAHPRVGREKLFAVELHGRSPVLPPIVGRDR